VEEMEHWARATLPMWQSGEVGQRGQRRRGGCAGGAARAMRFCPRYCAAKLALTFATRPLKSLSCRMACQVRILRLSICGHLVQNAAILPSDNLADCRSVPRQPRKPRCGDLG